MENHPDWIQLNRDAKEGPTSRWASLGPYYAMFPVAFARSVIDEYTRVGDGVLDPFAGRGTSLFCAREKGRLALGIEISPLGWIYGRTKLSPALEGHVLKRIEQLSVIAPAFEEAAKRLPEFFHYCFTPRVQAFLLAARSDLRWKTHRVDRTTIAFILTYLHGKIDGNRPSALSNQMRQTKAMAPEYSVNWWTKHGLTVPPDVDPVEFLSSRVKWRYRYGTPEWDEQCLRLGDCRQVLQRRKPTDAGKYRLLLTSPPYRGITSYYYDQWLRYWLLGETERPILDGQKWKSKYVDAAAYTRLLDQCFSLSRRLLTPDATIYVRTDARPATLDITLIVLQKIFPEKGFRLVAAPYSRATQTSLFGDRRPKPGEMDIILTPN